MSKLEHLEQVAKHLYEALPESLRKTEKNLEKKIREALQSVLSKLDLITREEFDVQKNVLERTRAKLAKLEKHISELEAKYLQKNKDKK